MDFIKFLVIVTLFRSSLIAVREINENGLYVPRIDGSSKKMPGSIPSDLRSSKESTETLERTAKQIPISQLIPNIDNKVPVITWLENTLFSSGREIQNIYKFRLIEFGGHQSSYLNALKTGQLEQKWYSLQLHSSSLEPIPKGSEDVHAYWCHQGGHVDIPIHPSINEPKFLFTPPFSGCSLVVDLQKINEKNSLRVYHVQGGKEDVEYNNLARNKDTLGMLYSMEYKDYGFHWDYIKTAFVENIHGMAFLAYSEQQKMWIMYSQSLHANGIPSISRVVEENGKIHVHAFLPDNVKIVNGIGHKIFPLQGTVIEAASFIAKTSDKKAHTSKVSEEINAKKSKSKSVDFNCV